MVADALQKAEAQRAEEQAARDTARAAYEEEMARVSCHLFAPAPGYAACQPRLVLHQLLLVSAHVAAVLLPANSQPCPARGSACERQAP